jgi:hypothetical protein
MRRSARAGLLRVSPSPEQRRSIGSSILTFRRRRGPVPKKSRGITAPTLHQTRQTDPQEVPTPLVPSRRLRILFGRRAPTRVDAQRPRLDFWTGRRIAHPSALRRYTRRCEPPSNARWTETEVHDTALTEICESTRRPGAQGRPGCREAALGSVTAVSKREKQRGSRCGESRLLASY